MSSRPVYLVVYNSPMFPAHWSMWVPDYDANTQETGHMGKRIHVTGDSRTGFVHEFERNCDMNQDERLKKEILLGWTDKINVAERSGGTTLSTDTEATDTEATDTLEKWALAVPAPGPSLRNSSSSASLNS
jgi:hypothetical protein